MSRLTEVLSSFLVVLLAGSQGTSRLAPADEAQFTGERVLHRADGTVR